MKESLKQILKLLLLFEFLILINVTLIKLYTNLRFYQFDLDGDYMFSAEECALPDYAVWELRELSDVGENLLILVSPFISALSALLIFAAGKIFKNTKFLKLIGETHFGFDKKDLIISAIALFLLCAVFFTIYLNSALSEKTILRVKDYLILCGACIFIFAMTVLIDMLLRRMFKYEFLINILWIVCAIRTFFEILYSITNSRTDSFLYLLLPLASVFPLMDKIIEQSRLLHNSNKV